MIERQDTYFVHRALVETHDGGVSEAIEDLTGRGVGVHVLWLE